MMWASPECKTGKKKSSGVTLIFEPQCDACIVALWFFRGVFVMAEITLEVANREIEYDPLTGLVRRKVIRTRAVSGWQLGTEDHIKEHVYLKIRIMGKFISIHRLAFLLETGVMPPAMVDHENGNTMDNKRSNLRLATPQMNQRNKKFHKNNTSGAMGVSLEHGRYRARIRDDAGILNVGSFDTLEEAAIARKAAEIHYGYHPNHGRKS